MKSTLLVLALLFSVLSIAQVPEKAEDISPLLIGENLPDATLLDSEGDELSLKNILREKPTVLVFYRGGWCPYCNQQLAALGESEQAIIDLGFQIVAISPDHFEMLKPTIESEKVNYEVYSDINAKFIQEIGIGFKTPEKAKGYIFKKTNKQATDVLPVPTVMIIDTEGKILYEYINPDYSTRLSSEMLLANLKVLKSEF